MNVLAPVSTIMSTELLTVNPKDSLSVAQEIFKHNKIHHLPVVRYKKLVGLISKSDSLYFLKGYSESSYDEVINKTRLNNYTVSDIMVTGIAKLSSSDRISVALKIFNENLFHAIPIVDEEDLVGIVTTYDVIKSLSEEPVVNTPIKAIL